MIKKIILLAFIFTFSFTGQLILAQQFEEQTTISLTYSALGTCVWGDYDNDGNLDLLMTGSTTRLYKNNGNNTFTLQTQISFRGLFSGTAEWGDYNDDGFVDLLLTGTNGSDAFSVIYKNNGDNTFTEQTSIVLFGVMRSSASWGDLDNDGDLDIYLSGGSNTYSAQTKIYRNNGDNTFTEITGHGIPGFNYGSVSLGDYDNDGDLDILQNGDSSGQKTKIYKNEGNFKFTEQINISIIGLNGKTAWGDYDNDGFLDILISGSNNSTINVTKIYRNNGDNTFSEQTQIEMIGGTQAQAAWGDFDNDGFLDIVVNALNGTTKFAKIYRNNGNHTFSEMTSIALAQLSGGGIAWGDYDNDGDLDLAFCGTTTTSPLAKIYKNNSSTLNTKPATISNLNTSINQHEVTFSWNSASDANQSSGLSYNLYVYNNTTSKYGNPPHAFRQTSPRNGKRLVAKIGNIQKTNHTLKLPIGEYVWSVQALDAGLAGGNFATEQSFTHVGVNISPIYKQVLSFGQNGNTLSATEIPAATQREWKYSTTTGGPYQSFVPAKTGTLYTPNFNQGGTYYIVCESVINSQTFRSNEVEIEVPFFTDLQNAGLSSLTRSDISWGDYDNDGFLDILCAGDNSGVYRNNGNNTFTKLSTVSLPEGINGSCAWGDYDNDGYLDFVIAGGPGRVSTYSAKIFRNNGNGTFTEQSNISLMGILGGSSTWADYDNDGDLDLLLSGSSNSARYWTGLYKNQGNNIFIEQKNVYLAPMDFSSVSWGDYNNDGYIDVLMSGDFNNEFKTKLYKNNGDGSFTEQTGISLIGVRGVNAWGDYNNDGYLDILIAGGTDIAKIYKNNGDNSFTEQTNIQLTGSYLGYAAWADFDHDGYIDVVTSGQNNGVNFSKIYKNNNGTDFTEMTQIKLDPAYYSVLSWADTDNDGDLDLLLSGGSIGNGTHIYRNNTNVPNVRPSTISNLQSTVSGNLVSFSWDKPSDVEQSGGLGYRMYAYNQSKAKYGKPLFSFRQTHAKNGKGLVSRFGDINTTSHKLKMAPGNYLWSVQAIDAGIKGGAFPAEQSFEVKGVEISPNIKQTIANSTNGTSLQAFEYPTASTREWKYSTSPGGPYSSFSSPQTGTSYTPNFIACGVYYIVCQSVINSEVYTSNEIEIEVPYFSLLESANLGTFVWGANQWGDYNNDGYLDILVTGMYPKLFKNNGNNTFTEQTSVAIKEISSGSIAWGDYDNDGFADFAISGGNIDNQLFTLLYKNNGNGTFTEQTAISFTGVRNSDLAWGDFDNDGDLDLIVTGYSPSFGNKLSLYRNDGNNSFAEVLNSNLQTIASKSVSWGDYNNDGFLDILLGSLNQSTSSKIYKNNGNGTFTLQEQIQLSYASGNGAWVDYNNDGYLDIMLTGIAGTTKIYKNNGDNTFSEQTQFSLQGVYSGKAVWGDFNNDGYSDLAFTGFDGSTNLAKIYRNDAGNGFSELYTNALLYESNSTMAWGDFDNDGDLDLLYSSGSGSKLYRNNIHFANTKPATLSNLQTTVDYSEVSFSWNIGSDANQLNGLSYNFYVYSTTKNKYLAPPLSLRQTHAQNGKRLVASIGNIQKNSHKLNLPIGNYVWSVQAIDAVLAGGSYATEQAFSVSGVEIAPIQKQIIQPGQNGTNLVATELPLATKREWKFSTNPQGPFISFSTPQTGISYTPNFQYAGNYFVICESTINSTIYRSNAVEIEIPYFTEQTMISIPGVYYSSMNWGDYNNDGLVDILFSGRSSTEIYSRVYKNNGNNSFTHQTNISLFPLYFGSMEWGDYDNDGYLDILQTGTNGTNRYTKIYKNNKNGTFTEQTDINLTGVSTGTAIWGDYDNDGYLDILLTGNDGTSRVSKIYRNNGLGNFVAQTSISITGFDVCSAAWGDYNSDGNLDFVINGYDGTKYEAKLYRNWGNNTFTVDRTFWGMSIGAASWVDYDHDGDLDLFLMGYNGSYEQWSLHTNNGNGTFTHTYSVGLIGTSYSSFGWGDYDNDGYIDVVISGSLNDKPYTKIFKNNNGAGFSEQTNIVLPQVYAGSVAMVDYDNDGDLDFMLTGYENSGVVSKIFRNNIGKTNTKPNVLVNLQESINIGEVNFSWDKGSDLEQQGGMNYNLYVFDTNNNKFLSPPHAFRQDNALNGKRLVAKTGKIQKESHRLNLPPGNYKWSVQAIDDGLSGGNFAPEKTFVVNKILAVTPNTLSIAQPENSTATFNLSANVAWSIECAESWLTVSKLSGTGSSTITLTATENTSTTARNATVTIKGTDVEDKIVTVTQAPFVPVINLSTNSLSIAAAANSSNTFNVSSNISWTVESSQSWLTANKTQGSGNEIITLTATANPMASNRTATITVSGSGATSKVINVTQIGASPNLSVSATSLNIGAAQNSTNTFNIVSNTNWNVLSNQSWLTLSTLTGSANASITLTAAKNPTTSTRIASITVTAQGIEAKTITVTQDASATGIEGITELGNMVYPNPVSNTLYFKLQFKDALISVYDLYGKLVIQKVLIGKLLDVSDLKSGVYNLKIESKNQIYSSFFVKQ
jgi:hypothetical protein